VRIVFDAHTPGEAARTLALAAESRAEGADTGVALPSRWTRSLADAKAAAEADLSVRLIKGQWPDDEDGAPAGEAGLRASYLRLLDTLVEHRVPVSVATHDAVLLERALARMTAAGAPAAAELLLGLPVRRVLSVAAGSGARVGFYVPYGQPGLPYPFMAVLRRPRLTAMLAQGIALGGRNQRIQQKAAFTPNR
jgi:proline dehydrogenase